MNIKTAGNIVKKSMDKSYEHLTEKELQELGSELQKDALKGMQKDKETEELAEEEDPNILYGNR